MAHEKLLDDRLGVPSEPPALLQDLAPGRKRAGEGAPERDWRELMVQAQLIVASWFKGIVAISTLYT